jgi:hypothetical protein
MAIAERELLHFPLSKATIRGLYPPKPVNAYLNLEKAGAVAATLETLHCFLPF